jgi:hypothetical protein
VRNACCGITQESPGFLQRNGAEAKTLAQTPRKANGRRRRKKKKKKKGLGRKPEMESKKYKKIEN